MIYPKPRVIEFSYTVHPSTHTIISMNAYMLQILMHVVKAAVIRSVYVPTMTLALHVTLVHASLATDLTTMDTPAMVIV